MSKRIFLSIWMVAIAVCLAAIIVIMSVTYGYFYEERKTQLRDAIIFVAEGVDNMGISYLDDMDTDVFRVTLIAVDGSVLYDNKANDKEIGNHLRRQEVADAFDSGYGEASRYSDTMTQRQFYVARLLKDGSVIRLSTSQYSAWKLLLNFYKPVLGTLMVTAAIAMFFALRLSKRIVKPLNEMNLDDPDNRDEYKEIYPLIERLREQRRQLNKDKEELEKTERMRREFTANASHELKTPLQTISGYAELIKNGMVNTEDVQPFAERIYREAIRMTRLADDIIDLARLDEGSGSIEFEDCDVMTAAHNAVETLSAYADEKNVTVTLLGTRAHVTAVPHLLYEIIYNLCDNAIKYNVRNGNVYVSVTDETDHVTLMVRDTGIGIPEDEISRIFERFYRVDKSRSKEVGGTGLGLSIVKHAAIILNADVDVKSTLGEGTRVTVRFERAK